MKLIKKWWLLVLAVPLLYIVWPLPDHLFDVPYSTVLVDKNNNLLAGQIADDGQWRFPASFDSIPENVKMSLLLFEDEYFYSHPGVNPVSIGRAISQNIRAGRVVSGGSTITMQLARIVNENKERSFYNKAYEVILAVKLELKYSKDEILRLYLSHAPFGGNVVGLEAACWRYYGRTPDNISWAEAATLAVLPNSPSLIYPGRNQDELLQKRNRLLQKVFQRHYLTSTDLNLAKGEKLPGKPFPMPDDANQLLTRVVNEGYKGQKVVSTIDNQLQKKVLHKVEVHHQRLSANHIHNAAVLITEVNTGNVLAYVGNTSTTSIHSPQVDIITAERSTGSILKPFLYALAVEDGLLAPQQLIPDIPTFFKGFAPTNFDNSYRGAVAADEALKRSLNIPFVYLLKDYSYQRFHLELKNLGMNSLNFNADHYGLSLILGGAEASLWDLTSMYGGMARTLNSYYTKGAGADYSGDVLFSNSYFKNNTPKRQANQSLSAGSIWWMFKGMQALGRPEELSGWEHFASARNIAWKTGTSYGFRDAWAIGTDGKYVVGVWAGNADGEGRPGLTGISAAAPIMFDIMNLLPLNREFLKSPPFEMKTFDICKNSGFLAGRYCESIVKKNLPEKGANAPVCPFHTLINVNENGDKQVTSDCYPVHMMKQESWFVLPPVQAWYYKNYHADYKKTPEFLCASNSYAEEHMEMIYPKASAKVYIPVELDGRSGRCVFEAAHVTPGTPIYWHLDDQYLGVTFSDHQMSLNPEKGWHKLRLLDAKGRELTFSFEVINEKKS